MTLRNPIDAIWCALWNRGLYLARRDVQWNKIIAIHVYARRIVPAPRPERAAEALLKRCTELGAKFSETDHAELIVLMADILRNVEPYAAPTLVPAVSLCPALVEA